MNFDQSKSRKAPQHIKLLALKHLNLSFNSIDQDYIFRENFGLVTSSLEKLYLVKSLSSLGTTLEILALLPKTIYELDLSMNEGVTFKVVGFLNKHFTHLQTLSFENCENLADSIEPLDCIGFDSLKRLELQGSMNEDVL